MMQIEPYTDDRALVTECTLCTRQCLPHNAGTDTLGSRCVGGISGRHGRQSV